MSVLLAKFRSNIEKYPNSIMKVIMEQDKSYTNVYNFTEKDLEHLAAMEGGLSGYDIYLNYDYIVSVIINKYI